MFTVIPDWVRLTWDVACLYRRGWVVQERWLSARIIHFSKFPTWECTTALMTEGFPHNFDVRGSAEYPGFPESQREWLFSSQIKMGIIERWWKLVGYYTKCNLTKGKDKLIALSGLAKIFSTLVNEPYYAGIWGGEHLMLSLLWHRIAIQGESVSPSTGEYRGLPRSLFASRWQ